MFKLVSSLLIRQHVPLMSFQLGISFRFSRRGLWRCRVFRESLRRSPAAESAGGPNASHRRQTTHHHRTERDRLPLSARAS